MLRIFQLGTLVALTLSAATRAAEQDPPDAASVGMALRPFTRSFDDAWNRSDGKAFAALFTQDAVLINPLGRQARGRAQIEALFREEHRQRFQGTTMFSRVVDVRVLSRTLAFVDEDLVLTGSREAGGRVLPDVLLHGVMLMSREDDGTWRAAEARPYQLRPVLTEAHGTGGSGAAPHSDKR